MRKTGIAIIALFAFVALAIAGVSFADDAETINKAQDLADQEKYEESNALLLELQKTNPDHPDVYWMISRNFYDMGELIDIEKNKEKKLEMYQKAEEWGKKGYDKNPGLADNAFWMAVGMSQIAQVNGVAKTLLSDRSLAKRIEENYIKSTKAKEFHYKTDNADTVAAAHYALGQFYRKIPDSFIVGTLMGTQGDMDKAVEHATKAREMYPNNIEYTKELGIALLCRGTREESDDDIAKGKEWLQKSTEIPAETQIDKQDHADAKKLIADPSMACGYSRVQQEEVSGDSFKE